MAFNLKEIQDNLTIDKLKGLLGKFKSGKDGDSMQGVRSSQAAPGSIQRGLEDIKVVLLEGKAALFVKQFVVLLVVFLLVRYGGKSLNEKRASISDQMSALQIQQVNKDDYLANKNHLLKLEPLFPDISAKQEWLLVHLNDIFEKHKMKVTMDGNVSEDSQSMYVVGKQPVTFRASFKELGKLLADIENGADFLRVTELTLTKLTDKESLGENAVAVQFVTVFPQNKYAAVLFKDYAEQMAQMKQQPPEAAQTAQAETEVDVQ